MADGLMAGQPPAGSSNSSQLWQRMLSARTRAALPMATPTGMATTQTSYGIPPELMAEISGAKSQIAGLAEQDPYVGMHGAYEDVIRNLASAYQSRGSQSARSTREMALSSGLSPLESGALGNEAMNQSLRQYYEMLPGLRLEQSGLQQKRWQDLANLTQLLVALAGTTGQGMVPTSTEATSYTFPQSASSRNLPPSQFTPEWADMMLKLAQASQISQVTAGRKKANELFYGGGLGPIAGGEAQTSLTDAMRGTVPGKTANVTVSPAVEAANKYEELLKFLSSVGYSSSAQAGAAAMGMGAGAGGLSPAAATPEARQYLTGVAKRG